jgi:threonine dehydrogenase-like Zn-dependent dehydrogenase
MNMKAMVLEKAGELRLDTFDRPAPRSREILVRVTNSGICGTDLKIFTGAIAVRHPLIMGHEMAGEIVAAPDDESLKPGQRVVVDPSLYFERDRRTCVPTGFCSVATRTAASPSSLPSPAAMYSCCPTRSIRPRRRSSR